MSIFKIEFALREKMREREREEGGREREGEGGSGCKREGGCG